MNFPPAHEHASSPDDRPGTSQEVGVHALHAAELARLDDSAHRRWRPIIETMSHAHLPHLSPEEMGEMSHEQLKAHITALQETLHSMAHEANIDSLTGLLNRNFMDKHLLEYLQQLPESALVQLFVLDLDGFKAVNDTYGHDTGDIVLQAVGHTLSTSTRQHDLAFRLGGDEFVVLLVHGIESSDTDLDKELTRRDTRPDTLDARMTMYWKRFSDQITRTLIEAKSHIKGSLPADFERSWSMSLASDLVPAPYHSLPEGAANLAQTIASLDQKMQARKTTKRGKFASSSDTD